MNADVASLSAPAHFWDGIKGNFMRSLGVDGPSRIGTGQRGLPVVVYIDGQVSRVSPSPPIGLSQPPLRVTKSERPRRPARADS